MPSSGWPKKYSSAHRHADEQDCQDAVAVDGLDALRLARAEILAGKGHGGVINGVAGRINERVEIACRRVRRDHVRAEGVDRGLDHDIGNIEDHGLKTRRQSDLDHAQGLVRVKAEFLSSSCAQPSSRIRQMSTSASARYCETTVAIATPATPRRQTITKNRFSSTLTVPETDRKKNGFLCRRRPAAPPRRSYTEARRARR